MVFIQLWKHSSKIIWSMFFVMVDLSGLVEEMFKSGDFPITEILTAEVSYFMFVFALKFSSNLINQSKIKPNKESITSLMSIIN
ncbi:MAG: hypothetical protein COZ80_10630 [Ignavibacteria bacterium CG_4_8_14_3_um_filter_37_9]|nr:MAG: hypothetical protein AUJ54_06430 [Ignavibacteria bacterium CG1_02_37_35]PIP77031.1 MAG: hypothetical protein COW85_11070 [Ignavibacteria bacterium CG22_combo_CG10-13_8_21_14_all_37_15]PIS45701.1 MAG: hypothetical protein COT22_03890 [Ignavibacteria bacterium CG08_land_8_20_14_0_20_37_9]PIW98437.1 MAG: hypothetical protein COZ80_10630 [Ignavibacteria bacterium CG_4_8_14_3_um_filter_37_9]PIX95163.1 MAG: hypothetical protein COZ25_01830 [Ignavibacteria bacterium CG_4_10_14_3_um_filter_37_1